MSQQELLNVVIEALEGVAIPYMLTGSLVSSLQGEPRATHDIDVIVSLRADDIGRLAQSFLPPRYYLDRMDAEDAVRHRSMLNLIDSVDGGKVGFWMLGDDEFDRSRFGRRIREQVLGTATWVSSPEDTILAKLRWAVMSGGSEKQFGDALRVYEVQHPGLDLAYLDLWQQKLGVSELWRRLLSEAEVI